MKHILFALLLLLAGGAEAAQAKFVGVVPIKPPQTPSGATVTVTVTGTGAPASLYADNGTTVVSNPCRADSYGVYQFTTAVGIYDLLITRSDGTTTNITKQTIGLDPSLVPWATPGTIGSITPSTGAFTTLTAQSLTLSSTPLAATSGGTGFASYTLGDVLYASSTTALAKLADVATGNVLLSGGVGAAPSYGKVALTTHVSGILPVANAGTGADLSATGGTGQYVKQASSGAAFTVGTIPSADIATALTTPGPIGGTTPAAITGTAITGSSITNSSLTSGRVVFSSAAGLEADSASLTWASPILTVGNGSGDAAYKLNGAAGNTRYIDSQSNGVRRWRMTMASSTAETGSDAGSNWSLTASDDSGVTIDSPISVARAAGGNITFTRPLAGTSLTLTTALAVAQGGTGATTAATARSNLGVAVDGISGMIELPAAKTYNVVLAAKVGYTINELTIQTSTGTCTAAVKINGTNVTGLSAVSVTSTPSTTSGTAANTVAAGDSVTLVLSSISSALDVAFTIKYTK